MRPSALSFRLFGVVAALVTTMVGAPESISGQTLEGTVPGAEQRLLVRLLDASGSTIASQVTDPQGRFLLAAPEPGAYRVQVERLGYLPSLSEPVTVPGGGRVAVTAPLAADPLNLAAAPDPPAGLCRPTEGGTDRLTLAWQSAMTAMEMALWNEERGELLLDAELHRRELEADGRTVVRADEPLLRSGVSRLVPAVDADDLLERGFIREAEDGSVLYYPPTPAVLTAPDFLASHCLRLQGPTDGPLVGVAFEPSRGGVDDARPDVAGVLWVSASDGRPLLLEFAFRNVDAQVVPASSGGRMAFTELPDGSWVTAEAFLRAPLLQVREGDEGQEWRVRGLQEERARLVRVRAGNETWAVTPESGSLEGVVLDGPDGLPVSGATVRLVGTSVEDVTDFQGRFRMEGLLEGVYRVSAVHTSFDALLMGPDVEAVPVEPGRTAQVTLAPPTPRDAAQRLCSQTAADLGGVVLTGQVVDSLTGEPLSGLPLNIRYQDPRREGRPYHETRVSSGAGGYYVYCDAPRGQTVRIRPGVPGASADDEVALVAMGPVESQDIRVELSTVQGESGVFGVIRDAQNGAPIEAAEVLLQETQQRALTNSNGFFAIRGVEPGLYVVDVTHIAYADRELVVRLDGGQAYQVDVTLEVDAIPLEGITVSVVPSRMFFDMVDMQRRMEMGFGDFVLREKLEGRGGTLASALQGLTGLRVLTGPSRMGERYIVLRDRMDLVQGGGGGVETLGAGAAGGGDLQFCFPAVWVDGARWSTPSAGGVGHDPVDFSQFVTMDIEAVEIYRGAASVPGEFGGSDAACGAVIVWTRRGGRTIRGDVGSGA